MRLDQLIPEADLPDTPCTLPWTQLQLNADGSHTPCSPELPRERARSSEDLVSALWNDESMRAFRRALRDEAQPSTCRADCPVLSSGSRGAGGLVVRGGDGAFVESQIRALGELLEGAEQMSGPPLSITLSVTSYCNYDCLMCQCGETGTLDDERSEAFYAELAALLPEVESLQLTGGEPLTSPSLLAFLETVDASALGVRVALLTNLSLLTPELLERIGAALSDITIALNAAQPSTYESVNRGHAWADIEGHRAALLSWAETRKRAPSIRYAMVILRQNLDDIVPLARLALAEGVGARFALPRRNRNESSIMLRRDLMTRASRELSEAARLLAEAGRRDQAAAAVALVSRLGARLENGVLRPL